MCDSGSERRAKRDGARRLGSEVRTERQREPAEPPERPSGEAGRVPTGCAAFGGFSPVSVLQHVFNKNAISPGRVLNKNVGNGPDQLSILDDWAAAHSLDDSAGEA